MSLTSQVSTLSTRIGTEFKTVRAALGANTALTTTDKSTLVAAINEIDASLSGAGATINDSAASGTSVYSSTKTQSVADAAALAAKSDVLGGAGAAFDTLGELQALMQADDTETTGILTALGLRLRFDAAQALTAAQKTQAQTNMDAASGTGVGNTETDFVAVFDAALL